MKHRIIAIEENSIAEELGLQVGDYLIAFDEQPVEDILDYQYYESLNSFSMTVQDGRSGEAVIFDIEKDDDEILGMRFENDMLKLRHCCNKCIFCFVDQLPSNMRPTMYVKDDDWRMSFIMGNYVTLTNLKEKDIQRIIKRKISPLYISVHATDPELRSQLLGNPRGGELMDILRRFVEAGIEFHAQVVLCPGYNDGFQLRKTFEDLLVMYPYCKSLAVVPVGLTYHRAGLTKLRRVTGSDAQYILDEIEQWQKKCLEMKGTRFIFASDEMYLLAGRDIPRHDTYEDYAQLENGVGMLAKMEHEVEEALADPERPPWILDREVAIACGVSVAPFIRKLADKITDIYGNLNLHVYPIKNFFFGESVTVTGLLTCKDIGVQLEGKPIGRELLISKSMLRQGENTFLDNLTVQDLSGWLCKPVTPVENDGESFVKALLGV
ncbi:MAG: DUF512 domain-containing protein [Clostridia bacterium]|nr:DUF512 domain-containing protein [Clostridia bacterium]